MRNLPLIIAHRGASFYAPENTLAAFRMAVDAGADGVEFDVQLAQDGVPVVMHDATLDRTAAQRSEVLSLTSCELGKIDVGTWFNRKYPKRADPLFTNETIPTLPQTLQFLRSYDGLIYIELKADKGNFRELVKAVCDSVRNSPLLRRIILKSFNLVLIPEIKNYLPKVQTAALFGPTLKDFLRRRKNIIELARECGADQVSLHYSLATGRVVSFANSEQMPVTIWTTDGPRWIARSRELGIKALITNDPAKMLKD